MAWRIDDAVAHGEIDNTVEGRTTGLIWIEGREEPLRLELDGDCWRDLAGTKLVFQNPSPVASKDAVSLETVQKGVVGDMTASRKTKVAVGEAQEILASAPDEPEMRFEWRNALYLEWFSESNGRVVIESVNYRLEISDREWQMDEDAEEAQKLANLNAMRDFMALVIRRRDYSQSPSRAGELDEFAWEERLKESDRLTDAYQEVLEKYMEDPDSERKEAFAMGWDGLLDALAERDEEGEEDYEEEGYLDPAADYGGYADADDEGEGEGFGREDDSEDDDETHPLQARAHEVARMAMDLTPRDAGPGSAPYRLVTQLLQVSGKLAGALNHREEDFRPERGFVLAVLKRCLSWLNDAVGACGELVGQEPDADQRARLEGLRHSIFEIRDSIVELRRELKQS